MPSREDDAKHGPAERRKRRKADLPSPTRVTARDEGFAMYEAKEVAAILRKSVITLERWRAQTRKTGRPHGPPFVSINDRFVGYSIAGFERWLATGGK